MFTLGPIGFVTPWLLAALITLPVLWLILRAIPPAPIRRAFPGVALLLGLEDEDSEADRTPWWLLLLRMLAVAAMILGFAGPILNPEPVETGSGPLVVMVDDSFAAAPDWRARLDAADRRLEAAASTGRRVAVVALNDLPADGGLPLRSAADAQARLDGLLPKAWPVNHAPALDWLDTVEGGFDTLWLSDGLSGDSRAALARALQSRGGLTVMEPPAPRIGLQPARIADGMVRISATRSSGEAPQDIEVTGQGPDPAGVERELARATLTFEQGATEAVAEVSLPPELRNRIARFEVEGMRSAGTVSLADDTLRRRKVALLGGDSEEGLELLSPLHYLREALVPTADVMEGTLSDMIAASPDVVILADVAALAPTDKEMLEEWVAEGGLLLRFAGPRLAAADTGRTEEDPLLPVRLRVGGRDVGGAMSWGEARALAPFPEDSPFYGLAVPEDVEVTSQVLAEPGPQLSDRTIAALVDGTPLVTRKTLADGQVVLIHVSANAEWSTLPLSGLFVQMLERLAVSTRTGAPEAGELEGTTWVPETLLDGFGALDDAGERPGVAGERLTGTLGPDLPPGLYADEDRRVAVNVIGEDTVLRPAQWPASVVPEWQGAREETDLSGWLLMLALAALAIDVIASLFLSGRLTGARGKAAASAALIGVALLIAPQPAQAQDATPETTTQDGGKSDAALLAATAEVTLAYVRTGDPALDDVSAAGLLGLGQQLFSRTSVEPEVPVGVDLETDELAVYPLLYWPVTEDQPAPSSEAYAKLNAYLRGGGMIVFDTRDGDVAGFGSGATPEGSRLRSLARPLDIPPLEPIPNDHVLTRAFYLLSDFPGRYFGQSVWVEASPPDAERAEGMPFRNLNDGVTPILIGGNDWASAWAVNENGSPMFPVGRGFAGERQREIAYRFGVNLVMHVLTGNYKSDQVHVPALLERLGQ
ncbi:DUF4159 domain-containing protein [Maritimibacter sp. UBA3975]|uniref:DUF4159 domain-containing protein n=1 Tax=Maritimibacter sp. UBA3975 TaxID=1946833 RepID=UPI000C0B09FA|nr:DUF4159 domain-containing protein [Maritimibacter sp. UBA3975]MAM63940.1 LytTR family transcriptional regulator [Maritimibacter sp.]|tara:strand:+ start:18848 stop:21655 length:2808 start_codon:yes stop_codon:yes gene_type:complete